MANRAPRNRTLTCTDEEIRQSNSNCLALTAVVTAAELSGRIVQQDIFAAAPHLPTGFVDLLILDPPYNLTKDYHGQAFKAQDSATYQTWFTDVLTLLKPTLKATATLYVCADWRTSLLIAPILGEHFILQNRITWEREKGRGAKTNWKNNTEDIWFCTVGDHYTFNVDAVKVKRRVLAPYRTRDGTPKDWQNETSGKYRLTHPANIWTDLTIPFWSMPENTPHPTQKPEKLLAKLLLASSNAGDFVFDPFLGSGTTAVVAQKLGRQFAGVEQNPEYCCWALKRLAQAKNDPTIQGYADGVFWERNTKPN